MSTIASQKTEQDFENFLVAQVDELNFIIDGLENNPSFNMLVDKWKKTNESLDNSWHLLNDPIKFNEARITKFAAMELINCISTLKNDLARAETELFKLRNPGEFINKDVDHQ